MTTPVEVAKILKKRQVWQRTGIQFSKPKDFQLHRPIRKQEISDFTRQLATMVQARLPLTKCLEILARQQKNIRFQQIINEIIRKVLGGKSLSESISAYPKLFNPLYVNMLRVGEVIGNMPDILQQLAVYMEKIGELKRKLFTALTYPAVIIFVAAGAISFLLFGVMPTFTDMFRDYGARMPAPTRILLGFSEFAKNNLLIILFVIVILIATLRFLSKTPKGSWIKDVIKLRIPLIGPVFKKVSIARFTRTLGTLLHSGVSLLEALDITAVSTGNLVLQKQINRMRNMAEKGESMDKSITDSNLFPPLVVQMIAVGEETAELPEMLNKTAEYYEREVDGAIDALTSVIEPVIIVVLGVILGGTIIAIYLQIFELMNVVQ